MRDFQGYSPAEQVPAELATGNFAGHPGVGRDGSARRGAAVEVPHLLSEAPPTCARAAAVSAPQKLQCHDCLSPWPWKRARRAGSRWLGGAGRSPQNSVVRWRGFRLPCLQVRNTGAIAPLKTAVRRRVETAVSSNTCATEVTCLAARAMVAPHGRRWHLMGDTQRP